eukprot:TRINITY_DN991_c0_g1_i16.p1 TRINITY_DN991_c0_g1~~TRINITY_DN991_c0_g1_i16.p1  ORF type:complete len:392 (-),score=71.53 TRINITY_DN991_c0_g1_i16:73-1248(-)
MLSSIFMIVFVPVWPLASWFLDVKGLYWGLTISATLNAVAACTKLLGCVPGMGDFSFWWVMAGQALAGISQTFFMGAPPQLAASWFPVKERTAATSIGSLANPVGIGLGTYMAPCIVKVPDDMFTFLAIQAAIMSVVLVVVALLLRSRPKTPPSPTTSQAQETSVKAYLISLKGLILHKDFMLLATSCMLTLGAYWAVLSLSSSLLMPFGYTDTQIGFLVCTALMSGVLSCTLFGVLLDRFRTYRYFTFMAMLGTLAGFVTLFAAIRRNNLFCLTWCWALTGWFGTTAFAFFLELGVECTYPTPETMSANLQLSLAQLSGIAFISIGSVVKDNNRLIVSFSMLAGSLVAAILLLCLFRGSYRRLQIERDGSTVAERDGSTAAEREPFAGVN